MSSFDSWLGSQSTGVPAIAELQQVRAALGATWPADGEGWGAYARAIAQSPAVADKDSALASLEAAHRRFADGAGRAGVWQTIASWVSNVYFWAVLLGGGAIFALFGYALDPVMLAGLARPEEARGLITFLFGVATVGIALVIVLAVFLSTGSKEEVAERFRMGKDILAVLIGVFGTIIGFYFGTGLAQAPPAPVEAVQRPAESR
ncbi:MAG: hypothetical protein AB7I59_10675 [Geminicoccaceae bacterium]